MSVTVGFSQASTSLIGAATGTTKPDGIPAEGGEAGLFAALLATLAPGFQPSPDSEAAVTAIADPIITAVAGSTAPPAETSAVAPAELALPNLGELTTSEAGKALLKEFSDALKAARTALDEGKPLDPALEKKLREAVDAVAAYFAGQPLLQQATVDTTGLTELATGSAVLPTAPDTGLPPAPVSPADAPAETPDAAQNPAPVDDAGPAPKFMQSQIVPARLAELGDVLKDFAAQLEKVSPDLAKSLAHLADRISVGDIADHVMAQLGLSRTAHSTSPHLDRLVAALAAAPQAKPATVTRDVASIAAPVLDIPDVLAGEAQAATSGEKTQPKNSEAPRPGSPEAPARIDRAPAGPSGRVSTDVTLDAEVKLAAKTDPGELPPAEARPAGIPPAQAARPAETPTPVVNPAIANPDAAATAVTAARAIHAAYAAPVQQLNLPQVAFEVVRQFEAGNTRFQIRLDPAELGRIDVKLDLDKNGTVNARLFVERPETLDLMMRDQRALQQALQQAGLDSSRTSLEFSLRQNPGSGGEFAQGGGNGGQPGFAPFGTQPSDEGAELAPQPLYRGSASASGINLFV